MNQHIVEGMNTHDNTSPSHDNTNDNNTLKMFKHNSGNGLEVGESIHLLGKQEMICTEQGADKAAENDYVPDESMEKKIYTALSVSFAGFGLLWYIYHENILKQFISKESFEGLSYYGIVFRLILIGAAAFLLGTTKEIWSMILAGLFFALGVIPVSF